MTKKQSEKQEKTDTPGKCERGTDRVTSSISITKYRKLRNGKWEFILNQNSPGFIPLDMTIHAYSYDDAKMALDNYILKLFNDHHIDAEDYRNEVLWS